MILGANINMTNPMKDIRIMPDPKVNHAVLPFFPALHRDFTIIVVEAAPIPYPGI